MATGTMPTVELSNGVEMPVLGFGVFQIGHDETEQAVIDALRARRDGGQQLAPRIAQPLDEGQLPQRAPRVERRHRRVLRDDRRSDHK